MSLALLAMPGAALAASESVLYSFQGGHDGCLPNTSLLNVGGTLYGTTQDGGHGAQRANYGTVFSITPAGVEKVLHAFEARPGDGEIPYTDLIDVGGALYGTTEAGGANSFGTVFKVTTAGKEKVVYSFVGDSYWPNPGGLANIGNTLYGTTQLGGVYGGQYGQGTLFSLTTAGKETVLHSFGGGDDARFPFTDLMTMNDAIYGSTTSGGANGFGAVFQLLHGVYQVVYSFKGPPRDAALPTGRLVDVGGTLYGASGNDPTDHISGAVFSVQPKPGGLSEEKVIYTFQGGSDGTMANTLISVGATIYGTTYDGGTSGHGTVFQLSRAGTKETLYSFAGKPDGIGPVGLVSLNGTLYGTTYGGGAHGCGTVFSITP